jgi:DNA-binding MarR family transcriptional regulator
MDTKTEEIFYLLGIFLDRFLTPKGKHKKELSKLKNNVFLINLIGFKENCTMKHVVDYLKIAPSTATGRIEKLVEDQYVIRKNSPKDRRLVELHLTDKGIEIFEELKEYHENLLKSLLNHCTQEEKEVLFGLMQKLGKNISIL